MGDAEGVAKSVVRVEGADQETVGDSGAVVGDDIGDGVGNLASDAYRHRELLGGWGELAESLASICVALFQTPVLSGKLPIAGRRSMISQVELDHHTFLVVSMSFEEYQWSEEEKSVVTGLGLVWWGGSPVVSNNQQFFTAIVTLIVRRIFEVMSGSHTTRTRITT